MSKVSVSWPAVIAALDTLPSDDVSLAELYQVMLDSTRVHERPFALSDIAGAWLREQAQMSDAYARASVDACVACLLLAQMKRAARQGQIVSQEAVDAIKRIMLESWETVTEDEHCTVKIRENTCSSATNETKKIMCSSGIKKTHAQVQRVQRVQRP